MNRRSCKHYRPPNRPAINFDSERRTVRYTKKRTRKNVNNLQVGMKESQVLRAVSEPKSQKSMPILHNYKPSNKPVKPKCFGVKRQQTKYDKDTDELFTITMSLSSFVKEQQGRNTKLHGRWTKPGIVKQFNKYVVELSKLVIEASYMVYHRYMEIFDVLPQFEIIQKPDFAAIFASLYESSKGYNNLNVQHMTKNYRRLRKDFDVNGGRLYDGANKTRCVKTLSDACSTVLMNNITDHTYDHIRKFFKAIEPDLKSYDTLGYLFHGKSSKTKHTPNKILLNALRRELKVDVAQGMFAKLYSAWYTYIPLLLRLQRWRHQRGLKNFRVFPIMHHKRHFIPVDKTTLHEFLNSMHHIIYNDQFAPNENDYWTELFNYSKLETVNIGDDGVDYGHKFGESFRTDGVTAHVLMIRKKRPKPTNNDYLAGIRYRLNRGQFDELVALDPGCRLTFGGVRRNLTTDLEQSIRYSSSSYRYDANEYRLNAKQQRFTNHIQQSLRAEREQIDDNASCTAHAINFLSFELKNFDRTNSIMMDRFLAKLNFQRYMSKQRAIAKIARTLVYGARRENERKAAARKKRTQRRNRRKRKKHNKPNATDNKPDKQKRPKRLSSDPNVLVFVGSTNISPIIKGYVRAPSGRIIKEMSRWATVVSVHEHRSTMLCSRCFNPCITSRPPHRWQHCTSCCIRWNRDINAGRNIMYLGMHLVSGTNPDHRFSHGYSFGRNAKSYLSKSNAKKPHTKRCTIKQRQLHRQQQRESMVANT